MNLHLHSRFRFIGNLWDGFGSGRGLGEGSLGGRGCDHLYTPISIYILRNHCDGLGIGMGGLGEGFIRNSKTENDVNAVID